MAPKEARAGAGCTLAATRKSEVYPRQAEGFAYYLKLKLLIVKLKL